MHTTKMDVPELPELVRNSTSHSEVLRKLNYSVRSGNFGTLKRLLARKGISTEHFLPSYHGIAYGAFKGKLPRAANATIFKRDSTYSRSYIRRIILRDNLLTYRCSLCEAPPEWKNQPLSLVLDHINGVGTDNRLENLRWLCPNCNAQTPTFSRRKL